MNYYSLNNPKKTVSFKKATIQGIAPDKGLYFPNKIPKLDRAFLKNLPNYSDTEIALEVLYPFVKESISKSELKDMVKQVLNFPIPLVSLDSNTSVLELFHGPTLAFKDVGARFMAHFLTHFLKGTNDKTTILVATSGDTGGAVADAFFNRPGIEVVILYPKGMVSKLQEKQLTTLGGNIKALEFDGNFDDCQAMVKKAFLDEELNALNLSSANSINVARWLPQIVYYFIAYKQLGTNPNAPIISVPSGNFGNICAGILANKMGLPISHLVASTNSNDTIPRYLESGNFDPKTTQSTITNAMDISNPSNFVRVEQLFGNNLNALKENFSSFRFTDAQTKSQIQETYVNQKYMLDPHGAVGLLGLNQYRRLKPTNRIGICIETAHPSKFLNTVENVLQTKVNVPERLQKLASKPSSKIIFDSYKSLKKNLLKKNIIKY